MHLVAMPGAPSSVLAPSSKEPLVASLLPGVRPGAPTSFLLLVAIFWLLLVERMLLVAMPGAPSSVFAPSSKARSPY